MPGCPLRLQHRGASRLVIDSQKFAISRHSLGRLGTFVAIRRASSQVRSLTPDRQPDASVEISLTKINDLLLGEYRAAARPHQDAIIRDRREWGVRGVIGV